MITPPPPPTSAPPELLFRSAPLLPLFFLKKLPPFTAQGGRWKTARIDYASFFSGPATKGGGGGGERPGH